MAATKFQITLPVQLASELKVAAQKRGIPLAEWIRTTMERELRQSTPPPGGSFFEWLQNTTVDDPATDVSSRIDEILYGGE